MFSRTCKRILHRHVVISSWPRFITISRHARLPTCWSNRPKQFSTSTHTPPAHKADTPEETHKTELDATEHSASASTSTTPTPPTTSADSASTDSSSTSSSSSRGPVSWKAVAFLVVTGTAVVLYYNYERERRQTAFQPVVSIGRAAIGGPFSLIDAHGSPVSSSDLLGRYHLMYFGFTHCPDICPTELKKMEQALVQYHNILPEHPITPIFISIDPQRDTPARLLSYQQAYSPSFLFLTGSTEAIRDIAKKYRVYYSAPSDATDPDYLVDHSIFFYLIDRQGNVMDYYGKNFTATEVTQKMIAAIREDNQKNKG